MARQLRLRNIGGIIVIDFIDMVLESNRDLVLRRLDRVLRPGSRTKHQVAEVTSLGLVQMTRKRVGSGLLSAFSVPCEHCNGRGILVSGELTELPQQHGKNGQQGGGSAKSGQGRTRSARSKAAIAQVAKSIEPGAVAEADDEVAAAAAETAEVSAPERSGRKAAVLQRPVPCERRERPGRARKGRPADRAGTARRRGCSRTAIPPGSPRTGLGRCRQRPGEGRPDAGAGPEGEAAVPAAAQKRRPRRSADARPARRNRRCGRRRGHGDGRAERDCGGDGDSAETPVPLLGRDEPRRASPAETASPAAGPGRAETRVRS